MAIGLGVAAAAAGGLPAQQPADAAAAGAVTAVTATAARTDSGHVSAPDPRAALPERPTVATHAYTVAPGYAELEIGGQLALPRGASAFQLPTLLKIGVAPRLQLDVSSGYAWQRATGPVTRGISDLSVGVKWRLPLDVSGLGDVAVQGSLKLPSAPASTIGTGTTDLGLLLISSHVWPAAELDLNAGVIARTGDGSRVSRVSTVWTASLGGPVAGRLAYVAELFGYPGTSGSAGAPPQIGFLAGPTFALHPWLVLDAGAILNVSHVGANSGYAGLTWNIGRI